MKNLAIMILTAFALTACHTHETRYVHTPAPPQPVYKTVYKTVPKKSHPKKHHPKKRHKRQQQPPPPKHHPVPVSRHHH